MTYQIEKESLINLTDNGRQTAKNTLHCPAQLKGGGGPASDIANDDTDNDSKDETVDDVCKIAIVSAGPRRRRWCPPSRWSVF